jgi:hypothetical protein
MPSSRWHTSATATAFWGLSSNVGTAARTRSTNSRAAAYSVTRSAAGCGDGTGSDGTRQVISPGTPSGPRLVASTVRLGHSRSSAHASVADASRRCSQLSSTSSSRWSFSAETSVSSSGVPTCSRTPSAVATTCGTSAGSATGANSTSQTPSA